MQQADSDGKTIERTSSAKGQLLVVKCSLYKLSKVWTAPEFLQKTTFCNDLLLLAAMPLRVISIPLDDQQLRAYAKQNPNIFGAFRFILGLGFRVWGLGSRV